MHSSVGALQGIRTCLPDCSGCKVSELNHCATTPSVHQVQSSMKMMYMHLYAKILHRKRTEKLKNENLKSGEVFFDALAFICMYFWK